MHRFYVPTATDESDSLELTGSEAHHAAHVLRVRTGDPITILNGVGSMFHCQIVEANRSSVTSKLVHRETIPEPKCKVTLLQALPKGKIIEDIIEKATELGVSRVVPLLTERVVTKIEAPDRRAKQHKWQTVAVEAIKQCGQAWLPKIEEPQTISEYLAKAESFELQLAGSLRPNAKHPRNWLKTFEQNSPNSCAVWVGPEGDFTPLELDQIEAAGATPITLGPLVLRCETAAIFCLSIVNYELFEKNADGHNC